MNGLGAVAWKEWRCLATAANRTQLLLPLLVVAFMPIWAPLEMGMAWLRDPILPTLLVVATTLILVGVTVPDAFAGERERRTLATLLASPLTSRAILTGKLLVPVLVNEVVTIAMLALSVIVANATHWSGTIELFPPAMLAAFLLLAFTLALFTAALGVMISMRASSVQAAQQVLISALMAPLIVGGVALMLAATSGGPPPDWLTSGDASVALLAAAGVLLILDIALVATDARLFRRSRLIVLD